jgi:replicative DNA helicase
MENKKTEKTTAWLDVLPLSNPNAELRVLGSIMIVNNCLDEVIDILTENDFYDYRNKIVFKTLFDLITGGKPADYMTVAMAIGNCDDWNIHDVQGYLIDIWHNTPGAANVLYFAQLVKQKSIDRAYIHSFKAIEKSIAEEAEDRHDEAQRILLSIENPITQKPQFISEFSQEVLSDIIERHHEKKTVVGLSSGYSYLDKMTNGFKPADYVILAARPSMGKTMFALNIVEYLVVSAYGKKEGGNSVTLFFSLEMTAKSILERLIAQQSGLTMDEIKKASFHESQIPQIVDAVKSLDESRLVIDDNVVTSAQIRSKCRQIKRQHGLNMVVIDYLQLINGYDKMEETRRITQISKDLKTIAKELNVPVIALSQLNRNLEQRHDKRPVMADLRQSGAIEQDADMIMFIYRDEVYNENTPDKGIAEIILAKNRDGETGKIKLTFKGKYSRFENYNFSAQNQIITQPLARSYKKKPHEFD